MCESHNFLWFILSRTSRNIPFATMCDDDYRDGPSRSGLDLYECPPQRFQSDSTKVEVSPLATALVGYVAERHIPRTKATIFSILLFRAGGLSHVVQVTHGPDPKAARQSSSQDAEVEDGGPHERAVPAKHAASPPTTTTVPRDRPSSSSSSWSGCRAGRDDAPGGGDGGGRRGVGTPSIGRWRGRRWSPPDGARLLLREIPSAGLAS